MPHYALTDHPDPAPDGIVLLLLVVVLLGLPCLLWLPLWSYAPRCPEPVLRYTIVRHLPDGQEETDEVYAPSC